MSLIDHFIRSAVRQIGRDAGKVISNQLFGDAHSTPIRGVTTSGMSGGQNLPTPIAGRKPVESEQQEIMNATIRTSSGLAQMRDAISGELALLDSLKDQIRQEAGKIKGFVLPICLMVIGLIFVCSFAISVNPNMGSPSFSAITDSLSIMHERLILFFGVLLLIIGGIRIKFVRDTNIAQRAKIAELQQEFAKVGVTLNIETNEEGRRAWELVREATRKLFTVPNAVWDTRDTGVNRGKTSVRRRLIHSDLFDSIQSKGFPVLTSSIDPIVIPNLDGPGMRLYPGFVLYGELVGEFHLIDYQDLDINIDRIHFPERDQVPRDTRIIDRTWLHTNKNGTRDKRYNHNPEIPVCEYGEVKIGMSTFHSENFMLSRLDVAQVWYEAIQLYRNAIASAERNELSEAQSQLNNLLSSKPS